MFVSPSLSPNNLENRAASPRYLMSGGLEEELETGVGVGGCRSRSEGLEVEVGGGGEEPRGGGGVGLGVVRAVVATGGVHTEL